MPLSSKKIDVFHIFLASPGDMNHERQAVRDFFLSFNRTIARSWSVHFEVIDWENYSTIGIGRPQELITNQTLESYHDSLALVIGLMGQRFGSPTGEAESGTEEEFNWALENYRKKGYPEIKWFFRRVDCFEAPPDPNQIQYAFDQWKKVRDFRSRLEQGDPPVFYKEFPDSEAFPDILHEDLSRWLADSNRPWGQKREMLHQSQTINLQPSINYYKSLFEDYRRLDFAGIDNDRAFEIPLSDIYVRLRVIFGEDESEEEAEEYREGGLIDIQSAMERYNRLIIVGDPGSGKSTFLKYIALMLARSVLEDDPELALETLSLESPLPIPLLVSCWDLSDFLDGKGEVNLSTLMSFLEVRLAAYEFLIDQKSLEKLMVSGGCCLLFDGLDEVPTDKARATVSRLLEQCVSHYEKNRYVVTSRIRAYTGDTILKGEFARCDIQPFNLEDRRLFLRNWFALLLKTPREKVLKEGSESCRSFKSLTTAIESKSRISVLAVNPLLLTVIAIVHWNRKRLPEQRVELYDECIDVLLGQRKEAERAQQTKRIDIDENLEEKTYADRAWVRKRFAEVALKILSGEGEDVTKADVIALLCPRFLDRGAVTNEEASALAEVFLNRQELRSGLLVSRRAHSYRFVHLTFQEYLAAWHLAKQEFTRVAETIKPHLREQKWFEALQLLGGVWAKYSDELLDQYIQWLLDNLGNSVGEQAPIVALCANILNDCTEVAEIKSETRKRYEKAVENTFEAFRGRSGVPEKTQLEILEALGKLGAAVKEHLIAAAGSSLLSVRRRALEMLVPHLPDDDLFSMDHVLDDRSKEPIKTYLAALLERDALRTIELIISKELLGGKAIEAILHQWEIFGNYSTINELVLPAMQRNQKQLTGKSLEYLGLFLDTVGVREFINELLFTDDGNFYQTKWSSSYGAWNALLMKRSYIDKTLMTKDLDARPPGYNPKKIIGKDRVEQAADRLNLSPEEVKRRYEALVDELQLELKLGWRKDK